jgi:hypothetical protein
VRSFGLLGVEEFLDGVGLVLVLVLVGVLLAAQELAPRGGGLFLLHAGQHFLIFGLRVVGLFGGADEGDEAVEEVGFLLVLFEQFVDFDIVGDDLFWVERGVPLRMRFSVSSMRRLR